MNSKAIILVVAMAVSFASAWIAQNWRYAAKEAERLEAQREHERANALAADKASEAHEEAKAEIKTQIQVVYRDAEKIIERPVYRNVCFDDAGLQLIARAIGNPATPSQPTPAVR